MTKGGRNASIQRAGTPVRPVRVAHLLWRLTQGGGVQTVVRQLATHTARERVDLHVVSARPRYEVDALDGLPATHHSLGFEFETALTPVTRIRTAFAALRALRSIRPEVVQIHSGVAWLGFLASVAMPRTAFVLEVHDAPGSGRHGALTDRVEGRWARLRRADVVCHSSSVEREVAARWRIRPDHLLRFPLGVDLDLFDLPPNDGPARIETRAALGIADDRIVVTAVGRMVKSKRFDLAIEATRRCLADGAAVTLLLIGDGPDRAALEADATDLVATGGVVFAGPRFGTDLVACLRASDVLVSTSAYEGFGLTLVEAMAAELPTVAMSVGGVVDIVVDGTTGYLVEPSRLDELVRRLTELSADPDLRERMGKAGRARAETEFAAPIGARRFAELYQRAATRSRRPGGRSTTGRFDSGRLLDIAILAAVAVPAALLGAACAVAVRLTSRGPTLFRQERVGRDGTTFTVLKFRTMIDEPNPIFPDASRITSAGRILRRLSLDELPQLINVARGEMSVIGPRPTLRYQVDRYDDRQRRRLEVRPGLTGLAQVSGRNALSWADRIDLDIEYVDRKSLRLDLSILARTARALLSGEGVEGHPTIDDLAAPPDDVR